MEQTTDEIKRLQGCINDLISVLALPAIWSDHDPAHILGTLLDVVSGMLRLDFAYARMNDSINGSPIEVVRLTQRLNAAAQTQHLRRAVDLWLTRELSQPRLVVPNPIGEGEVSIARLQLGLQDEDGILVAGSRRADFPTEIENLLLRVAANQAAIGLQEARDITEHKRVEEVLEQRVAERTSQLTAANEELTKEITERKRAEEVLRESEERFRLMVEGVKDYAIFMLDTEGRVSSWNAGAQRIKGYRAEEILGKHFSCFYCPEDVARGEPQQFLKKALAEGWVAEEGWRVRQDGSLFWASVLVTALLDDSRQLRGFSKVTHDITERKRADEELRRSEAYLAEGQRLSHTGSWAWNASSGEIYSSQELLRIFGLEAATAPPTHEAFLQVIHPEDRERVRQAFDGATHNRTDYEAEYSIVRADGSLRYVHNLAHPVVSESRALVEYVGTAMDITERYHAAAALSKALEEIHILKERLHHENIALREEIDRTSMFEEIVGSSHAMRAVLSRVAKVAPMESTVLVTGETGTGKELIARAIHKRSKRADRPFVAFNCAGIPLSLIASELFGHERGAFTGAQQRRLGRFELAEGGTIFLDEVGELPGETQIALLRVIQEREFERVGGSQSIQANVRIIAATNRDLEDAVVAGTFRLDLFYRLNVFPIEVPPLRERKQDIPLLLEYFVKRHAKKAGKNIQKIDTKTVELFVSYPWPGNIRELQSVIERSVILCDSEIFSVDDRWLSRLPVQTRGRSSTLSDMLLEQERKIIESALAESKGRIAGRAGAAANLGIPSSTLESKIRTLKIKKNRFKSD